MMHQHTSFGFMQCRIICLAMLLSWCLVLHTVKGQETSHSLNDDEIIDKYFLAKNTGEYLDLKKSFTIGDYENIEAINWLNKIKNANSEKALGEIVKSLGAYLVIGHGYGPPALQKRFSTFENNANTALKSGQTIDLKKKKISYQLAYFLHAYYLDRAKNSVLELNPKYGRSLYIDFSSGKIPEDFQAHTNHKEDATDQGPSGLSIDDLKKVQDPEEVKIMLQELKDKLPFGYYGLIPILIMIFGLFFRRKSHASNNESNKKENSDENGSEYHTIQVPLKGNANSEESVQSSIKTQQKTGESGGYSVPSIPTLEEGKGEGDLFDDLHQTILQYLYAQAPFGNIFHKVEAVPTPFYTSFILTVDPENKNEAQFTLVSDHEELQDLINTNLRLIEETCYVPQGKKLYSAKDIVVLEPGIAQKKGDNWMIVKKITLG